MADDIENSEEDKNIKNVSSGGNIFDDSFFDTLNEIDDGLGGISSQKLGTENNESINDIISEKNINLESDIKLTSKALPVAKLPQAKVKENDMNKTKFDPLNLSPDDPNSDQLREIWEDMNRPDVSDYKLMAFRMEPATIKGVKISGYLETFHLPTSLPEVVEQIGQKYGGGRYQIRIVTGTGKYIKSKTFEISGLPKIPSPEQNTNQVEEANKNNTSMSSTTSASSKNKDENDKDKDKEDTEDIGDEWDEDIDVDPHPRNRLRPIDRSMYNDEYYSYREPLYQSPYSRSSVFQRKDEIKDTKEIKEVEQKVEKLESKFDKIADMIQNNVINQNKSTSSILNPDIVKALAPVVVTWLDGKANKDTSSASQFSEMNKQVVGLMQGMQDLVRVSDKSKVDLSDKEREDRDRSRREMLEYQQQMEQRFIDQQRRADEKHQQMMLQLKESLEGKHREALDSENKMRLEYEKLRQEFREKEERTREEARAREEKLRDEARVRDENARRAEIEFRERMRQDETKWREEIRQRDEEARRRELEVKEEIRQKEIQALNDTKVKELELMKQMREMDQQKTEMQQKLLEQVYSQNNHNRESQLHMELAIAKMTNDNEARIMQSNAEMQLEKIRHATQMQMQKMKHDLVAVENKKSEDPIDSAMQDYLRRKLQIDMIKDLNMEVDDSDIPNGGFGNTLKKLAEPILPLLFQLLAGGGNSQMKSPVPNVSNARQVTPSVGPIPPVAPAPSPAEEFYEDESEDPEDVDEEIVEDLDNDMEEEEGISEDEVESEDVNSGPDLSNIDPEQEIPIVSEFFKYLKDVIQNNKATPEEAAKIAQERLSPEIVKYLSAITDSQVVINQLYPLLFSLLGQSYIDFFNEPGTLIWMNKMLEIMNKKSKEVIESEDVESVDVNLNSKDNTIKSELENTVKPESKVESTSKVVEVVGEPIVPEPVKEENVVTSVQENNAENISTKGRRKRQKTKNVQQ